MTTSHSARSRSFLIDSLLSPDPPSKPEYEAVVDPVVDPVLQSVPQAAHLVPHPVHPQLQASPALPVLPLHQPILHSPDVVYKTNGSAFPYNQGLGIPTPAILHTNHQRTVSGDPQPAAATAAVVKPVAAATIGPRKRSSSVLRNKPVATALPASVPHPLMRSPLASATTSTTPSHAIFSSDSSHGSTPAAAASSPSATSMLGLTVSNNHHQQQHDNSHTNHRQHDSRSHSNNKCNASAIANSNNNSHSNNNNNKKKTGIPVGIAVARQRNNKDSQISPKSVVLVTHAMADASIGSNSISAGATHPHHQLMQSNGTNGAKVIVVPDKLVNRASVASPILASDSAAASFESVMEKNDMKSKLLLMIPTTGSPDSTTGSLTCRSSTPVSLSSSPIGVQSGVKAPAIASALVSDRKVLRIATDDESDRAHDESLSRKKELADECHHRLILSPTPVVGEEDLLLKKVPLSDLPVNLKTRSDIPPDTLTASDPMPKSGSAVTRDDGQGLVMVSQTGTGVSAVAPPLDSLSPPKSDAIVVSSRLSDSCSNIRTSSSTRVPPNMSAAPASSAETNALVVEQNQSVLNFINARGLDLLVDLVEQQQPDNFSQTITRHVSVAAADQTSRKSKLEATAGRTSSCFYPEERKASKEESNLELLSMLCEQRCRDEESRRQQSAKENNKRRLSYPPPTIVQPHDSSQHQAVDLSVTVSVDDQSILGTDGVSSCSLTSPPLDPDRESCVPLKKRAKRFSSLDPQVLDGQASHDDPLHVSTSPVFTTSPLTVDPAADLESKPMQRTVPSITIQTSPKNSNGHPGLTIKIKNGDHVSQQLLTKPIKVLLKKRKSDDETRVERRKGGAAASPDRKAIRKMCSRKEEANKGSKVSLDLKQENERKKKSKREGLQDQEIGKKKNKGKDRGEDDASSSLHASSLVSCLKIPKKKKREEKKSISLSNASDSNLLSLSRPPVDACVDPYDFPSALPELDVSAEALNALKKHKKKRKKDKREKRKHRLEEQNGEEKRAKAEKGSSIPQINKNHKKKDETPSQEEETGILFSRSSVSPSKVRKSPKKAGTTASKSEPSLGSEDKFAPTLVPKREASPAKGTSKSVSDQKQSKSSRNPSSSCQRRASTGQRQRDTVSDGGSSSDCHVTSNQSHNNQNSDWFAIRRSERIFFAHEFGSSFSLRDKRESDDEKADEADDSHEDNGCKSADAKDEERRSSDEKKRRTKKTKARVTASSSVPETKNEDDTRREEPENKDSLSRSQNLTLSSSSCSESGKRVVTAGEKRKRDHKSKHAHRHHHKKHKKHKRKRVIGDASDDDGDDDDDDGDGDEGMDCDPRPHRDADANNGSSGRCLLSLDSTSMIPDADAGKDLKSEPLSASHVTTSADAKEDKCKAVSCSVTGADDPHPSSTSSTGISIRFTHLRRSLDSEASETTTIESNPGIFCWEFQGSPVKKSYQSATRNKNKTRTTIRKDFFNAVKRTRVASTPVRRISSESDDVLDEELDDEQEMILKVGECAIFCSSSPGSSPPVQADTGVHPLAENRSRLPFIGRIDSFWRETSKTQSGSSLVSPGSTVAVKAEASAEAPAATTTTTAGPEKGEYNLRKGSPNKKPQKVVKVLEPQPMNRLNNNNSVTEEEEKMMVKVRWFYHPLEAVSRSKKSDPMKVLCDPDGGLFESFTHSDENDVQTIASKCLVLPYDEFKERKDRSDGSAPSSKFMSSISDRRIYYLAGKYEPLVKELTFEPGVPLNAMP